MCMNLNILITESQKKLIIKESIGDEFAEIIRKCEDLGKSIISQLRIVANNDKLGLLTFSASVGGFMGPVMDFIEGRYPTLNDVEISLILTGVVATFFFNSPTLLRKIKKMIVENDLENEYSDVLSKSRQFKNVFFEFLKSLNITLFKVSNILAFTFLIPLLPYIHEISSGDLSRQDVNKIVKMILSYATITISAVTIKEIIKKLIKRFKS
jgi:hypothetical protein